MRKDYVSHSPALPHGYMRSMRWEPCYNIENEEIPPFACMQLRSVADAEEGTDYGFCQHIREGQIIWDVGKCDAKAAARQTASQFVFNGPVAIPKNSPTSYGMCTRDFPALVLMRSPSTVGMDTVGPVADQWYVDGSGSAFRAMSFHAGEYDWPRGAYGRNLKREPKGLSLLWVDRGPGQPLGHGSWRNPASVTVSASAYVAIPESFDPADVTETSNKNVTSDGFFLTVAGRGLYAFGFQAAVKSATAPRGAGLALRLDRRQAGATGALSTSWVTYREQSIEEADGGSDIHIAFENMAMAGIIDLEDGEALGVKNISEYTLSLMHPSFWLARIGESQRTSSQVLQGFIS